MKDRAGRLSDIELRLKEMDRAGIDIQAVSPAPQQTYYWNRPGPGRGARAHGDAGSRRSWRSIRTASVGLGTVPLQNPDLAVSELIHAVKTLGLRGVEINGSVNGIELTDSRLALERFFAKAEELGIVVFIHPTGFTTASG